MNVRNLVLLSMLFAAPLAAAAEMVPFIDDDYAAALKQARASRRPVFVDAWAPW